MCSFLQSSMRATNQLFVVADCQDLLDKFIEDSGRGFVIFFYLSYLGQHG